jgi:TonB family protein
MAARNKPYDQFGPYILFKKLETDSLGDLWRAGRIDSGQLGSTFALRRLSGGNRAALAANAESIAQILPRVTGASFVRDQQSGVIDGVPHLAWEYAGGRSLRYIIDRARGGKDQQPNPLPLDQAMVIAEKVALSLATMADLKDSTGTRLSHGALIPQFVWISDDGEIRVAGQQLGPGLIASLSDAKISADVARYLSPEYRASGQSQKNTDVFSLGALLFLLLTGQEPPDAATASAFGAAVRAAKTMTGTPVPDDIRVILDKSFNIDPSMRYATMADMKQALSALAHGGKYSATTFNLAFYLSSLLKKDMEVEAVDREKESKVNVAPYLAAPAAPPPPQSHTDAPAMFLSATDQTPKSKLPLMVAAVVVVAALGAGGYYMMNKAKTPAVAAQPAQSQALAAKPPAPRVLSEPIAVAPVTATTGSADPAAQQKAFEEAVRLKLQAEMMKLQGDFMTELKQKQSKNAPVVSAPPVAAATPAATTATADERPPVSAAQLDQQRRDTQVADTRPATPTPAQPQPTPAQSQPAPATTTPAPVAAAPAVREGDVVDASLLDALPRPTRPIRPVYPPMAARQKIQATIIISALIDENGEVGEVKVLRGDARFGLNDAAIRALRSSRFSSPMKNGKRVKTWYPQTIQFVPN